MYLEDYGTYFKIRIRKKGECEYISDIKKLRDILVKIEGTEELSFFIVENGETISSSYLLFTKEPIDAMLRSITILIPKDLNEELLIDKIKSMYAEHWHSYKVFKKMVEV